MRIAAHKNLINPPGQIVSPIPETPGPISPAKTLADQIERHTSQDGKKLTFEEWAQKHYPNLCDCGSKNTIIIAMEKAWLASRENL